MKIAFTANSGAQCLEHLSHTSIDVLVLDYKMPVMDGLETLNQIRQRYPSLPVLILTVTDDSSVIMELHRAGANGYLLKDSNHVEFLEAIRQLKEGKTYFHGSTARAILESLNRPASTIPRNGHHVTLTVREKQVLSMIIDQLRTQDIAARLNLSPHTIETHRKNLLVKTGCKNSAGLVRFAMENNLLN